MRLLSAWAITAMMPTVSSLASGMSAATKRTFASCKPSKKWALRLNRSIRAITKVALRTRHNAIASRNFGRALSRPVSFSSNAATSDQRPPSRKSSTAFF
jgi:hypothetical protein